MVKNFIVAALATNWLLTISPYTFHGTELIVTVATGIVFITAMLCMLDKTVIEHVEYKKRRNFRRLIGITTLK